MAKLLFFLTTLLFLFSSCSQTQNLIPFNQNSLNLNDLPSSNVNITPYENQLLAMINQIRTKGAKCAPPTAPLHQDIHLQKAAMMHARDLALNNLLQHDGSGTASDFAKKAPGMGSYFVDRIIFFGYPVPPYHLVGENVTKTNFKSKNDTDILAHFKRALKIYVDDPTHCKILMNPRFQDVGIGVYKKDNAYYWVVDFGERL